MNVVLMVKPVVNVLFTMPQSQRSSDEAQNVSFNAMVKVAPTRGVPERVDD